MKFHLMLTVAGALSFVACKYDDNARRSDTYNEPAQTSQAERAPEERYRAAEESDQVARLEARRQQLLDELYMQYGGGKIEQKLEEEAQEPSGSETVEDLKGGAAATAEKVDRAVFNKRCHDVGEGEEQTTATEREKEFFAQPEVIEKCKEVYQIDQRLDAID